MAGRGVLRLVVLSACQSALTPDLSPIGRGESDANLARALVNSGVPAAIGMAGNFPDAASAPFAETLYAALVNRQPLDEALRLARTPLNLWLPMPPGCRCSMSAASTCGHCPPLPGSLM